jgi:predicted DNA-binding protein
MGRPRADDPKIKADFVRLKTSTLIDLDIVAEKLNTTKSKLVQVAIEKEIEKMKEILQI